MSDQWSSDATLGSGLPDRFEFTIGNVKVDHPYKNNPTAAAVVLDGERRVDDDIDEDHLWLKVGAFDAGDKEGTFLLHEQQTPDVYDTPGSKKKKINNRSSYGKFLASFAEAVGGFGPLIENQDPSRRKYEIWDVSFWKGLVLDIEMVEEKFDVKDDKTGEQKEVTSRQAYVRGLLGKADGVAGAPAASTEAPAPAAATNGTPNMKDYDSHMAFAEAWIKSGGDTSAIPSKDEWEAARAG